MLINFKEFHEKYLIGRWVDDCWQFTPMNSKSPKHGAYVSSHQVFSNNALLIGSSIYNVVERSTCVGVKHCLSLHFSRKEEGKYLLKNDPLRISFDLDIGIAGELYALAVGHITSLSYTAIRSGKAPKKLSGKAVFKDGRRHVFLSAHTALDQKPISIHVDLDRADQIALAAQALGYGKLLYPSFSDTAIQSLLSDPRSDIRACAENTTAELSTVSEPDTASTRACADSEASTIANKKRSSSRLGLAIWAIGNQKWPKKRIETLQFIQGLDDTTLQKLINEANAGDFQSWDAYLPTSR